MDRPHVVAIVCTDPAALAKRAADEFEERCAVAAAAGHPCAVALSGGKTPKAMLAALAGRRIDWERVHVFWSDERCVPPDDAASNYKMARDTLLANVPIPDAHVHRMKGELPPAEGAEDYRDQLRRYFDDRPTPFDVCFLGVGGDGHTASLFPSSPALKASQEIMAIENPAPEGVTPHWRITLTRASIGCARRVIVIADGTDKAAIVARVLEGPFEPDLLPAQAAASAGGEAIWLLDAAAASRLRTIELSR